MNKVINITLNQEEDVFSKYDPDQLEGELLEYIIKKAMAFKKQEPIKIIIKNNLRKTIDFDDLLKKAFATEYQNVIAEHERNNIIQFFLFLLGFIFIVISFNWTNPIGQELFLIAGWVPIWEMVDLEIFNDVRGQRRKKILRRLSATEIVEEK